MSTKVMLDEREALDVLDLMRTAIPDEIKQARRTNQERERILAQAQTEANRVIGQAQERIERMVTEDSIRIAAEQRAREIVEHAAAEAAEIHQGADNYAVDLLERLNVEVRRIEGNVRNAMKALTAARSPGNEDQDE